MRLALLAAVLVPAFAADVSPPADVSATLERFGVASTVGQSPWLVIAGRGGYQYFTTPAEHQDRLGWSAHPLVFGTLGVLLLLVGVKDTLLSWLGPLKTPLDVLAEVIHVTGGVAGYVYLGEVAFTQPDGVRQAAEVQTTAWTLSVASYLMMCVVHTAVWLVFNTVEVAVILNPFPLVDTAMKSSRTALIGLIAAAAAIHPVLGFVLALPVVLACLWLVPKALRLTWAGWVICYDTLARWCGAGAPGPVRAFASWHLAGVTMLRYGVVERTEAGLSFTYRRLGWLWKRAVPLPEGAYVGIGTMSPLLLIDEEGATKQLLMFAPRYDGREAEVAARLGIERVENVSLGAGLRSVLRRLRERMFGRKAEAGAA